MVLGSKGSQIWKSSPIFRGEHKKSLKFHHLVKPWAASNRESLFCSPIFQVNQPMFVFGGVSLEESGIFTNKTHRKKHLPRNKRRIFWTWQSMNSSIVRMSLNKGKRNRLPHLFVYSPYNLKGIIISPICFKIIHLLLLWGVRAIDFCWVFCLHLDEKTSSTVLTLEVLLATVHKYLTTNWHVNVTFHYTCVSSILQLYIYIAILLYYTTSTNDSSPGIFGHFLYTRTTFPCSVPSSAESEPPCFLEQKIHGSNRSSPALEYMTYATQLRLSRSPVEGWNGFRNGGGGFPTAWKPPVMIIMCIYTYTQR